MDENKKSVGADTIIESLLRWIDNPPPPPPDGHSCGPDANCDMDCMERGYMLRDVARARGWLQRPMAEHPCPRCAETEERLAKFDDWLVVMAEPPNTSRLSRRDSGIALGQWRLVSDGLVMARRKLRELGLLPDEEKGGRNDV